ncbi:MAG: DUF1343 domain-containing protein, partial [Colwellia sp.]
MSKFIILFITLFLTFSCGSTKKTPKEIKITSTVLVAAEQLSLYLPLLVDKKIGLVVNQTSMVGDKHLVDVLIANKVDVQMIFAPEHGFRGNHDAGEKFNSSIDHKTGVPIVSIYGENRKPAA